MKLSTQVGCFVFFDSHCICLLTAYRGTEGRGDSREGDETVRRAAPPPTVQMRKTSPTPDEQESEVTEVTPVHRTW